MIKDKSQTQYIKHADDKLYRIQSYEDLEQYLSR